MLLMRRRHHEFLHHWDGQRALIEHEVVKLPPDCWRAGL